MSLHRCCDNCGTTAFVFSPDSSPSDWHTANRKDFCSSQCLLAYAQTFEDQRIEFEQVRREVEQARERSRT